MTGKVAIITGASQGIGAGLAAAYRARGWAVVASAHAIMPSESPDLLTVAADLTEPASGALIVDAALERFGRIDTLVNNAGAFVSKPFTDYTAEDYALIVAVNLTGFFRLTQRAIAEMATRYGGHVVTITATLAEYEDCGAPAVLAALTRGGLPGEAIADLRRRIAAMRWPSTELVADRSQGVQLATIQELARYWATEYDWRRCEARLNALPQFTTRIDGVDIHFIQLKSQRADALPLIITHGWPGSVIELLEVIGPLTDPAAHGGRAEDAFDLVLPSLPGYGFSGQPAEVGWDPGRIGRAWAVLMDRLGYTRYVAQGGDQGAGVTDAMGRQAPEGLAGLHLNFLRDAVAGAHPPAETAAEERAAGAIATFRTGGFGYFLEQATRPQTIGYALLDSPVALAAWMLDHDTDSYYKISRAFVGGQPSGGLTRDHILDNITVYWLTGTGASAARSYWEGGRAQVIAAGQGRPEVKLPVGFTTFPDEIFRAPRSWVEQAYPNLTYFHEADRGGHFAAWEEPELFATEIRAAFTPLRPPIIRLSSPIGRRRATR